MQPTKINEFGERKGKWKPGKLVIYLQIFMLLN